MGQDSAHQGQSLFINVIALANAQAKWRRTADEKVAAERRRTARAAVKSAEDAKAAAVSVVALQAHEKRRQVVAGLQQSKAANW